MPGDEALRDRILRDGVLDAVTSRMQRVLLRAHEEARNRGHSYVGTEHVFLAILLDRYSIPAQVLEETGIADDVVRRIQQVFDSDGYRQPPDQ
jgi:ATP-dependent Clp protease ATP-binding subunit ClpC